jgi:hypothetical protein
MSIHVDGQANTQRRKTIGTATSAGRDRKDGNGAQHRKVLRT